MSIKKKIKRRRKKKAATSGGKNERIENGEMIENILISLIFV